MTEIAHPSLGIDPGIQGAAVLLAPAGGRVLQVWYWRRLGRSKKRAGRHCWRITTCRGLEAEAPTLSAVGRYVAMTIPPGVSSHILTVEGLFGRGRTLAILSESAAAVYGPVEKGAVNDLGAAGGAWRPRSSLWRRDILGIESEGQRGAEACEQAAVVWAGRTLTGLGELAAVGHVAEAAALAEWGRRRWGFEHGGP